MYRTLPKTRALSWVRPILLLTLLMFVLLPALAGAEQVTSPSGSSSTLVDINAAGAAELVSLPGIGPALARRIIAYRGEHGPFGRIEELLDVRGIGPKMLDKIRPKIRVGRKAASSTGKRKSGSRNKKAQ